MKILQINKFLYPKGGSESYMFELSLALKEYGHTVEFWGMQDEKNIVPDTYDCFADKIDFSLLKHFDKIKKAFAMIYSFTNRQKISIVLDAFQPDIVHIHNYNFQLTPSILQEIKKRDIKIVYTAHDSQLVCPYHRLYNFQRDRVCTQCVHNNFVNCFKNRCFDDSYLKSAIGTFESYFYHSFNYYNKYIDTIISPSNFLASFLAKVYQKSIVIIPNFTNTRNTYHVQKKDYVLYFGRISNEKGILEVLPLFEQLKIKLLIIGQGAEANLIENNEYIEYLGAKYEDELFSYITNAKYVIQPSKGYENCPMAVIESLSCGTPVIAPSHSGFIDLIDDGINGYLINFESNTLKDRIANIYYKDTQALRQNCLKIYQDKFTKEVHISKILALYERLIRQ